MTTKIKTSAKNTKNVEKNKKDGTPKISQKYYTTRIIEDIFTDEVTLLKPRFEIDYNIYLERLWEANHEIYNILKNSDSLESAREGIYNYLDKAERKVFDIENDIHILEKATIREAVRVFKSIIGPINEKRTGFSALYNLWKLANEKKEELSSKISIGFIMECIYLFKGVAGKSNIYLENGEVKRSIPEFIKLHGREAAISRSGMLDEMGLTMRKYFRKYPSGLDDEVKSWRANNKAKLLKYFNADEDDWNSYQWQIKNVIRDAKTLLDLIELPTDSANAIKKAVKYKIPFGVTPYYLTLMDSKFAIKYDHAIRSQVLPPKQYVDLMVDYRNNLDAFDFMGEHDTSPIDLVTRRYPLISIIKPFNTCAQICVYCQRNWEIKGVLDPGALASKAKVDEALDWLDEHKSIGDILITGGDPMIMNDKQIERILEKLSQKDWIYRIRIGTRTPVVLPQRWTKELISILEKYHRLPRQEISIVTHFEHSYEITPEAFEAVQKIRKLGISIYNQEVFTVENSRRFETAKLRRDLKSIGIDPYYNFNMKGKEETRRLMVPIARILQERKEEARLLPGLDRTDEPVFNVPRMGKNHLRAGQDHRLVMILPDGSRVYEFHPWEKNISPAPPYNYVDVPIYDYLEELAARGENINEYRTIWYYY
jgi:lysine 2,3-aminomutase